VFVEAAERQSGFFHQVGDAEPIDTRLTQPLRSNHRMRLRVSAFAACECGIEPPSVRLDLIWIMIHPQ
jgi:hypothetical protein